MSKIVEVVKGVFRRRPEQIELEDYLAKLAEKGLHADGTPVLDPVPLEPPIGYKKHPSMVEIVRDMVQRERLAQEAAAAGFETFEESEDFDIGDDPPDMRSGFENDFDPPIHEVKAEVEKSKKGKKLPQPPSDGPGKPQDEVPPSDGPE